MQDIYKYIRPIPEPLRQILTVQRNMPKMPYYTKSCESVGLISPVKLPSIEYCECDLDLNTDDFCGSDYFANSYDSFSGHCFKCNKIKKGYYI